MLFGGAVHSVVMPVSTSRVREIRKQLSDIARDLEGDEAFVELADIVAEAADVLDGAADEMGELAPVDDAPEVAPGVPVGGDEPEPPVDDEDDAEVPVRKKRRGRQPPPSFGR